MEKTNNLVIVMVAGFILVLSFAFVSANTLVGGKIYNSDFSEVVQGVQVSVNCGGEVLDTLSLSDGAYAVTFDSDACYSAQKAKVTATKGDLTGQEESIINNSTEEEGEYVAVANINIKSSKTVSVSTTRRSGGWFECGNTVCDSGETHETCASDCPLVQNNTLVPLVAPAEDNSNSEDSEDSNPQLTQTTQQTANIPGITGAVTGTLEQKDTPWYMLGGFLGLLIIIMAIASIVRSTKTTNSWDNIQS